MREPVLQMTADWHQQRGAWARMPQVSGDAYFYLTQIIQYQLDHPGLEHWAAGDLFDVDRPDSFTLRYVFEQVTRLQQAGRRLFFTQGQHERANPPYLGLHPWPVHAHRRLECCGSLRVYGLDYQKPDHLRAELDQVPADADILVCHQVWSPFMGVGVEADLSEVPRVRLVVTGDYHRHLSRVITRPDGTQLIALSPGASCMQDITEPREHGFFVIYDDLSYESVKVKSRRVHDLLIRTEEDLEELLPCLDQYLEPQAGVPPQIARNLLCVTCADRVPNAYQRIVRAARGEAYLFWRRLKEDGRMVVYGEEERATLAPLGLVGCLPLVAPEGTALYRGCLRLLTSQDPRVELGFMAAEIQPRVE